MGEGTIAQVPGTIAQVPLLINNDYDNEVNNPYNYDPYNIRIDGLGEGKTIDEFLKEFKEKEYSMIVFVQVKNRVDLYIKESEEIKTKMLKFTNDISARIGK